MGSLNLQPPQPITPEHAIADFECGHETLDRWLKRKALANEASGASRTYVLCDAADGRVIGYYALAAGSVARREALGKLRRNTPDPIPVMVLGRLAVDRRWQGRKLGAALLRDAILRTLSAAGIIGARALLVHALDDEAARFYRRHGFLDSPIDPRVLMLPLETARKALTDHEGA